MDTTVPRKAVVAVAFILLAMSALGIYQGWRRAGASETDGDGGLASLSAAPVAGAKNASALSDPLTPALTEAQVRDIARQEARAALGKPATTATADAGQEEASPTGAPKTAPALLPPKPIQAPALQTPVAPTAPGGGDGPNQAPLF